MTRLRSWVTQESVSGTLLLTAAIIGLLWANSPWRDSYQALNDFMVGPSWLHAQLSLETWASEGLLTMFFFVVGLELKHEFVRGSMRHPRQAAVPIIAAVGGTIMPAAIFVAIVVRGNDLTALHGWAIPAATDIAFALGVLAVFGRGLPVALRMFLLTLAVVDDLIAILVIALLYTETLNIYALLGSFIGAILFAVVSRARFSTWWLLAPIASMTWLLMHESGVHSTIAGVLMGLSVAAKPLHGEEQSRALRYEHFWRPISSGFTLPVFAFFAAGVSLGGSDGAIDLLRQPVSIAIIAALVIGKSFGVLITTALVTKFTRLHLPEAIGMRDLLPIGFLAGIGFTVSLLIADLAFTDSHHADGAILAVLTGSFISAILGAVTLRWDARKVRSLDMNQDGQIDSPLDSEPWP